MCASRVGRSAGVTGSSVHDAKSSSSSSTYTSAKRRCCGGGGGGRRCDARLLIFRCGAGRVSDRKREPLPRRRSPAATAATVAMSRPVGVVRIGRCSSPPPPSPLTLFYTRLCCVVRLYAHATFRISGLVVRENVELDRTGMRGKRVLIRQRKRSFTQPFFLSVKTENNSGFFRFYVIIIDTSRSQRLRVKGFEETDKREKTAPSSARKDTGSF